jgi:hypothetical protein
VALRCQSSGSAGQHSFAAPGRSRTAARSPCPGRSPTAAPSRRRADHEPPPDPSARADHRPPPHPAPGRSPTAARSQRPDRSPTAAPSGAGPITNRRPIPAPGRSGTAARTTEDGLIWDIYSQVGAWLKSGAASNPLTYGHRHSLVQEAYGFGYSQTGGYLIDYINAINPLVVKSDRRPIYDGYLVGVAGGAFVGTVPINQCSPAPAPPDPRTQIHDVGVPVIQVMSQSDYLLGIASRRPDGNSPPDQYRHYEMAGAAHATPDELEYSAAPADVIKSGRDVPASSCDQGPRSRFPSSIHFDAAMSNLNLWVRGGVKPPPGRDIDVVNGAPVLDRFGNVTGGLRSPFVDVPTSTWFGSSTGPGFCFIVGHEVPFDQATLQKLYPTHGAYVRAVIRDVLHLVAQRYLTLADGLELIHEAQAASVP